MWLEMTDQATNQGVEERLDRLTGCGKKDFPQPAPSL